MDLKKQSKRRGVHFQHRFRYGKTETSRKIIKLETTKSKSDYIKWESFINSFKTGIYSSTNL